MENLDISSKEACCKILKKWEGEYAIRFSINFYKDQDLQDLQLEVLRVKKEIEATKRKRDLLNIFHVVLEIAKNAEKMKFDEKRSKPDI
jgi:hypothetical protein